MTDEQLAVPQWRPPPPPRFEAERALMEFGHDPGQIDAFLKLTPSQRLESMQSFANFVLEVWRRNGTRPAREL